MPVKSENIYAVLAGVCDYTGMNLVNLPACMNDVALIRSALTAQLNVPDDQIRILDGQEHSGFVRTKDLAHAMSSFRSIPAGDVLFVFYFSGHGRAGSLIFSDGEIELESVIRYISKMPVKSSLLLFDCCYSGNFEGPGARRMQFQETLSAFAGTGTAIFASSSADGTSRLGPDGTHSMFTGALAAAVFRGRRPVEGKLSLDDICEQTLENINQWNRTHPGMEQHPVFRSGIGGTIYFEVEPWEPYRQMNVHYTGNAYRMVRVKPLSTGTVKRLAAFIVTDESVLIEQLPAITKEIAERIRYAEVHANKTSEQRFRGQSARVIWCYFGKSDSDLINSAHYAYTIWAADDEMKRLFYKDSKHARVLDGIYLFLNPSYDLLKEIQKPSGSREELIRNHQTLLAEIVTLAEAFIYDLQAAVNQNTNAAITDLRRKYGPWIGKVRNAFIRLSDEDVPPDDLHDWAEEIVDLAGWVMNLAILLERAQSPEGLSTDDLWLVRHAVGRYYRSMEKLKTLEHVIYPK